MLTKQMGGIKSIDDLGRPAVAQKVRDAIPDTATTVNVDSYRAYFLQRLGKRVREYGNKMSRDAYATLVGKPL